MIYPKTVGKFTVYSHRQAWHNGQRCYRDVFSGGSAAGYLGSSMVLSVEEQGKQVIAYFIPDDDFVEFAAALDRLHAWTDEEVMT